MSSKSDVQGALGSLLDTLVRRNDPSFPPKLAEPWLGVSMRASGLSRKTSKWNALPAEDPSYQATTDALVSATIELANAGTNATRLAALTTVDAALDRVAAILA